MPKDPHHGEAGSITRGPAPLTHHSLCTGLKQIGLRAGDLVLLHTSLSRLGWVCGAEQSVLSALSDVLGPGGTLVMPGFSSQLSDPANWSSPPIPPEWVAQVQDNMPLFDRVQTPIRGIGRVAQLFHNAPGTRRSQHPVDSFLARGPLADMVLADHPLQGSLGPASPLGRLYENRARVLLLGAGYDTCTCFHLAEHGLSGQQVERYPVDTDQGRTRWAQVTQPKTHEHLFGQIGAAFEKNTPGISRGFGGAARLFELRDGVDFARHWFGKNGYR